jgi:hypothetical protein
MCYSIAERKKMNIEKEIEEAKIVYETTLKTIECTRGFEAKVSFISHNFIYMGHYHLDGMLFELHNIKEILGNYKLEGYEIGGTSLVVRYCFENPNVIVVFYCVEPEKALDKVSNGKCRIQTKSGTTKRVVCDL